MACGHFWFMTSKPCTKQKMIVWSRRFGWPPNTFAKDTACGSRQGGGTPGYVATYDARGPNIRGAAAPPREGLFFFSPRRAARGAVICFLMNELKKGHRYFLPPRDKQSMGQNSAKRDLPRFFCLLPRDQRKCPTTPVRN